MNKFSRINFIVFMIINDKIIFHLNKKSIKMVDDFCRFMIKRKIWGKTRVDNLML